MAEGQSKRCFVCKQIDTDALNYGDWECVEGADIHVHYFCLVSRCHAAFEQNLHK